ncbi:Ribosomal protein L5 like protein [Aduncisulcus paluster]|uniref:Ribosomal protein L5 like protein n=1 Tax=Aduncisulcus paluster TaxID=2918883 RepID=A0ABQ5JVZ0_9EUKA|nr:Ribosomal protein L5 like protein [Aduncisulcus paluster]|eukprot:gnl/Carplike_NY0171/180_a266_6699.p1 GENE.gnl/Carplike_NY0171/180_a266_6699~~gnl/Carplike_NY0171/180_a266_6699.p1  ORF type:complete len:165 (+),score=50.40 gnl/Carplike_NY0171/180_a266_6699:40-534(+)
MKDLRISKLICAIRVGTSGDPLTKASRVLESLTGQTPVYGKAKSTIRTFSIRRNEEIATYVTVRGPKAIGIIERALRVTKFTLLDKNFSDNGCFGFGISEHIDLDMKYDPAIGIFGMEFYVVLTRPGNRVAHRKHCAARIGKPHRVTKEDAKQWVKEKFDVEYM